MVTRELTTENLVERLRGRYMIPIDDGCGPIDGSDVFVQEYEVGPIQKMAANEIEQLRAANALLRTHLAEVQGRVVEWIPAGAKGAEMPADAEGECVITTGGGDVRCAVFGDPYCSDPYLYSGEDAFHWNDIAYYLPLSSLPLPKE